MKMMLKKAYCYVMCHVLFLFSPLILTYAALKSVYRRQKKAFSYIYSDIRYEVQGLVPLYKEIMKEIKKL